MAAPLLALQASDAYCQYAEMALLVFQAYSHVAEVPWEQAVLPQHDAVLAVAMADFHIWY